MEKNLVKKLYQYLKEKYGIQGTEIIDKIEVGIYKEIEILIPGVVKNSNEHKWVAFLEIQDGDKVNALIIGQNWKDDHCSWSRYLEIKNNDRVSDFARFKVIDNTFLGNQYDFKSLMIFIEILRDFSETI